MSSKNYSPPEGAAPSPVLEIENVSKTYVRGAVAVTALESVSLSLHAGEFVALCGPSGSGKSTLLSVAGLIEAPTRGMVKVQGVSAPWSNESALTELRRVKIGFVFQYFNLLPSLSAIENVATTLLLGGVPWREAEEKSRALLDRVGLSHRLKHRPDEMSGGEMQRVALARALAHGPPLILADEPTGNLDSGAGDVVLELLREVAAHGTSVLMVTHSDRAAAHCRRTFHMLDGRLSA